MEAVVIDLSLGREQKAQEGFVLALHTAEKLGSDICLLVGSKGHFPDSLIQYFLPADKADLLSSKGNIVLDGIRLRLESSHTISKSTPTPVLFVVYDWSEIIPKVKRALGVKQLIVLAPNNEEAQTWQNEFVRNNGDSLCRAQ
ncbi:MAG: hypothetical protein AB1717_03765 [Pseudomonadota bacterium]